MTTLENAPHTTDLILADFCPFLRVKSALKRRRFCFVLEVIEISMRELKGLVQMAFRNVQTHLQSLAEVYSCKMRDF